MKFTEFQKASKRYSVSASIPLSQAQQDLSVFFGFKNFNAAQKSMKIDSESLPETKRVQADEFWCGLNITEFKLLIYFLEKKAGRNASGDSLNWFHKSIPVFKAAIQVMSALGIKPLKTEILSRSIELPSIEALCIKGIEKVYSGDKSKLIWKDIGEPYRELLSYLANMLPAYSLEKMLMSHGYGDITSKFVSRSYTQDSMSSEQYNYRYSQLNQWIFSELASFELYGLSKLINVDGISLKNVISGIVKEKRLPTENELDVFNKCFNLGTHRFIYG